MNDLNNYNKQLPTTIGSSLDKQLSNDDVNI